MVSKSKKNVKYYNCGKKGQRDGKVPKSSNAQGCVASISNNDEILYSETTIIAEGKKQLADVWFTNLRATRHMTSRREWFYRYEHISLVIKCSGLCIHGMMIMPWKFLVLVSIGIVKIKC